MCTHSGGDEYAAAFVRDGYFVFPRVLSDADVAVYRRVMERFTTGEAVRRRKSVYGVRNLLEASPEICELAARPKIWRLVTPILGPAAFAARATFFNKTPDANWALGWHQDSVISVAERVDHPGFRAWGRKAGVWQVQPPAGILARMLALRIHLDDCGPDNGALRVIPGSHRQGWLDDEIPEWKRRVPAVTCSAPAGGVVAMCPLILHASSRAVALTQRRVIHIEYANHALPGGLQWNRRIRPGVQNGATPSPGSG